MKTIELGTPTTVGELRELLVSYSDEASFGFRNQPIQTLFEVTADGKTFIVFQERE